MTSQIYIGIDLGGTNIKVGICDDQGKLQQTFEGPTGNEHGVDFVLERIAQYARQIIEDSPYEWSQVAGIGAGMAGFLDIPKGFIKFSNNLGWHNIPAKDILESKLQKPVKIDNDANAAALGEAWSGAGKGVPHLVCYTLGTGVGGGIIINGKIHQGANGMAGELGHAIIVPDIEAVQCSCGQRGCLETVSSATGIVRMAKEALERGEHTSLRLLAQVEAKSVFDAAKSGDEVAMRVIHRAAYYLGKSIANVAVIVNPNRFIIGGGVAKAGDILFDQIRESFKKYSTLQAQEGVDIVPAILGNNAGVVGAAGLNLR